METAAPLWKEHKVRRTRKHKTVPLKCGDQEADIDCEIAPLIHEMWKANIETSQSCQASPQGYIWLQFLDQIELAKFLNIISRFDPAKNSLFDRMQHGYDRRVRPRRGQWVFETVVRDWSVDEVELDDGWYEQISAGEPDYVILSAVHFPCRDLPLVLERLAAYNRRHTDALSSEGVAIESEVG